MLREDAAADWSAVYLHDTLAAAPAMAGLGYALFAAAMLTVRLAGNTLLRRFRPHILLSNLAVVATLGFGTAPLLNHQSAALAAQALAASVPGPTPRNYRDASTRSTLRDQHWSPHPHRGCHHRRVGLRRHPANYSDRLDWLDSI
jgi:hypothetical protein